MSCTCWIAVWKPWAKFSFAMLTIIGSGIATPSVTVHLIAAWWVSARSVSA